MTDRIERLEDLIERHCDTLDGEQFLLTPSRLEALLSDPAILAHVPGYAALREENERLKATYGESGLKTHMLLETYRSRLHGLCQGPEPSTAEEAANHIRARMRGQKDRIADLESQLAALQGGGEVRAYAYELAHSFKDGEYGDFYYQVTSYKPNVPEGGIRNLQPLYTTPQPSSGEAKS